MGLDAALLSLIVWKFKDDIREIASLGKEGVGLTALIRNIKSRIADLDHPTRWLYGLGAGFALFLGVISLQAPTFVWDCKSYHVPRILNWIQNKSLRPFPTSDIRRVAYAPGAEIASTTLDLLNGSDQPVNLPSWFAVLTSAILASFVTELLAKIFSEQTSRDLPQNKVRLAAAFAFVLVLTIPEGQIQAISTENDFVAALWNLSLACMTILFLREKENMFYAGAISVALALGICTKVTTFISAAPFLAGAFCLLALRRSYDSVIKLAGLALVIVALLNAPWWMRNFDVFGHALGPSNVSAENVNPSFGVGRDLANIIRNLSIYTSTPSATVTKALNNAVRALVYCTGRPLDDPTSIVPYRDPNQALHFALPGPGDIGNGDGFGNVSAWLIIGAVFMIAALPFRNTFGFYAGAICAGFCLSCIYLRWHPWLFRYHMTYFVLAMPVVAIAIMLNTRSTFTVILSALCLVNAVLILAFNTQYPIYAPFLKLSREQHSFGSNQNLRRPYIALAEDVLRRGCTNLLLDCATYNFDYGLWVCLQNRGYRGTITEFMVQNQTAPLTEPDITSRTATVFIGNTPPNRLAADVDGKTQPLLEIVYLGYFGNVAAQYPSPFPGKWCRLLGPENSAELSFTLSDTDDINPTHLAEVHFACKPVFSDGRLLTNNVLRLAVDKHVGDVNLRTGAVDLIAIAPRPSIVIRTVLLDALPTNAGPAYLSRFKTRLGLGEKTVTPPRNEVSSETFARHFLRLIYKLLPYIMTQLTASVSRKNEVRSTRCQSGSPRSVRLRVWNCLLVGGVRLCVHGRIELRPKRSSSDEAQISALLSQMTLDEKVGQMTQADSKALANKTDVQKYFIGSVLSGGGKGPADLTAKGWLESVQDFESWSLKNAARHSHSLRNRRRSRTQQCRWRGDLSAQHRPRSHAQRRAR